MKKAAKIRWKKVEDDEIAKIVKNICKGLKNKGKDIYYIAKYDLEK